MIKQYKLTIKNGYMNEIVFAFYETEALFGFLEKAFESESEQFTYSITVEELTILKGVEEGVIQ